MQKLCSMEEDIDIYADLSTFPEKCYENCKQCSELEAQIQELAKKVEDLQKVNQNLEVNISSLLLTAKGEVSRKDRMIADLRRELDDLSFRRGKFRRHANYKSNFESFGSNAVIFAGDGVVFNPSVPPPPLPEDFKTNVLAPLPENFKPNIPPPPLPKNIKNENVHSLPEVVDTSEYTCNSEPYFEEEDDTEQKYEPEKITDTLFSKRLRKKLEEEDRKKILEKEETKKKFEQENGFERIEKEKLRLNEETGNIVNPPVPETEKESTSKCNLDNKENLSCSNQLNTNSEFLVSQSKVPSLEEDSSRNRPVLINKLSTKRFREVYDEEVDIKRPKMDSIKEYDDFREDWSDGGTEPMKVKEESESLHLNGNKKSETKLNGFREEKHREKKLDTEISRHDYLASRLYHLSEESVLPKQQWWRDFDQRKEDINLRSKDREKYEKDRYGKNKYKDKYEKEIYENAKYKEKLEKERFERDKCKDRFEKERYEWDKYDKNKFEKERFETEKYDRYKYEKDMYEREKYEREQFEKDKRNRKRFRRSQSLSPERMNHNKQNNFRYNEFKDNFATRNQRNGRFQSENLRENLYRPNKQESQFISESFKSRKERNLLSYSGRSRSSSNDIDRRERELRKCSSNSERSRSNGKDMDYTIDPDRKISLENYRARREKKLIKNEFTQGEITQRYILERHKTRLEKDFSKYDFERSRSSSKDKDCRSEYSSNSKSSSRQSRERVSVKMDLTTKDLKLQDELKKSRPEEDFEKGEISNSTFVSTPLPEIHENREKKESLAIKAHGTLDTSKTKIEDNEKDLTNAVPVENLKMEENKNRKHGEATKLPISVNQVSEEDSNEKNKQVPVMIVSSDNSIQKIENVVENLSEKNKEKVHPVSEKKIDKIFETCNEKANINQIPKDTKLDSKPVDNIAENLQSNLERHVQNLDSFIESAKKVLEENKKSYRIEEIARKAKEQVIFEKETEKGMVQEEKMEIESKEAEDTSKKRKVSRLKTEASSPIQERKKHKKSESKEREEETEISDPVKEKKKYKRTESREKEEEKEIFSPVKERKKLKQTESKEMEERREVSSPIEEKKIKIKEKEDSEDKVSKPLKELNAPESKKKELNKMLSPVKDQKQEEVQPKEVKGVSSDITSNISNSVKERREQFQLKETQKSIQASPKVKEVKPKEPKRQIQKVKQEVPEIKPKTKKAEEKICKKVIIVVKRRNRPVVLSDSNASTTIKSSGNVIMNIKLNNSGDKNLLS